MKVAQYNGYIIITVHTDGLTHNGDKDLGQHWHQAITWTNVNLSSERSIDIHLRTISQAISPPSIAEMGLKIIYTIFHWNLPGVIYKFASQVLYSLGDGKCYHKVPSCWNSDIPLKFYMSLGSSVVESPVKFQSGQTNQSPYLVTSKNSRK